MKRIFTLLIAFLSVFAVTKAADVVFNVVVPSPTYQCWIVGNFNGWNNNEFQLTKVDDTHFTITLDNATWADGTTTETVRYKYLSGGGDWAYVEKDAEGAEITDRWYAANDTVQSWAMTFNPNVEPIPADITIDAYVPKNITELYLTGSFNGWQSPGSEGTQMKWIEADSDASGNFFSDTIHTDDANKLIYKFAAGPSWVYEQTAGDITLSDPTATYVYHENMEFKRVYPGAANLKTVTFTVTAPAGTQHLYMMGSHLGWDGKSWKGARNVDGKFTFTVEGVDLMEYKYYSAGDWGTEEKTADMGGASNRGADAQIATEFTDTVANWNSAWNGTFSPVVEANFDAGLGSYEVVGAPAIVAGKVGTCLQADSADYVKIPISNVVGSNMSVSFWYNLNPVPNRAGIIGISNYDSIPGGTLWNNHFVQGMHLFREQAGEKMRIKSATGVGSDANWNDGYDIAMDAGWVYVTYVAGNGESKIYVNGMLGSNGNVAATGASVTGGKAMDVTNCTYLEIGHDSGFEAQGWNHHGDNSMIDEVKLYNIALSDIQVSHSYDLATETRMIKEALTKAYYAQGALNIVNYTGKVAIYDITGKVVVNSVIENGVMPVGLTQGIYLVRTENANFKMLVK